MTTLHAPRSRTPLLLLGGLLLLILLAVQGVWSRSRATAALALRTDDAAVPIVTADMPSGEPATDEVVLPGTVQALIVTPIFARTNGYVKRWYTDIGSHVKAGQILAEIESPEIDQELRQAEADLRTAQANNQVAQATARRVHMLLPTQSVSQEQEDQSSSDAAARAAAVAAAGAEVGRLRQLVGFERVAAPYAGIVTARQTDVGNLINAGSGSGSELFRVADTRRLRIYVQVPQSYAGRVHLGVEAYLTFPEYPGETFPAALVHTADAIDPQARTLLVELQVDNASGRLFPGGYVDVHFKLPGNAAALVVPANALLFRSEGLRVATVDPSGRVTMKAVRLGRDFGTNVEILTGLDRSDRVILNPPASLQTGQTVRIVTAPPAQASRS